MFAPLAALALVTSAATPQIKLAQGGVSFVDVSPAKGAFFVSSFDQRLSAESGYRVVTQDEVAAVLGLERQKAMLGCSGESSCTAELAGALGVDGIIIGTIAQIGGIYSLNLKVVRATNGEPLSNVSFRTKSEAELLDLLDTAARQISGDLRHAFGGPAPAAGPSSAWLAPVIGGGVAAVAGAVAYGMAKGTEAKLRGHDASITTPALLDETARTGQLQQTTAVVLGAVGLVAIAGGLVWRSLGSAPVTPTVAVAPGTAVVGLAWSWP